MRILNREKGVVIVKFIAGILILFFDIDHRVHHEKNPLHQEKNPMEM